MTYPQKVDGFGTRYIGSDKLVNINTRDTFVRVIADEDITKGDLVAFSFAATEPASGYGNHVLICDTGDALNKQGIGVATAAIASGDIGTIQVAGICRFAKVDQASVSDGNILTQGSNAGLLDLFDTSATPGASGGDALPVAICVKKAADNTASSVVYLMNPLNL